METVEALTVDMAGHWLITADDGTQHIIDLDDGTYRPPGERWYMDVKPRKLTKRLGLPVVGETFGKGDEVTRIARIPDMDHVRERFAEGWAPSVSVEFGWYPIVAELNAALAAVEPEIRYVQIKEKFGHLRAYLSTYTDEVKALIAEAEARAAVTCERCGDEGRMRTRDGGWLQTLCARCGVVKGCDSIGIGDTVDELHAGMGGVWLVTTQGSTHVWNLDSMTYMRIPGAASLAGSFDHDGEAHPITRIGRYPRVGDVSVVWFDDPDNPLTRELFRQSSTIVSIERIVGGES